MAVNWNTWHGCHKKSEGCKFCYVYRSDGRYGKDSSQVTKNQNFDLPIKKNRNHEYKVKPGELIYSCFTSDFLLEDADIWRKEAWDIIRERKDCKFLFLTKRIERFSLIIPEDWNDGWDHVAVGCTCENQKRADERLPIFMKLPIKHKLIICEPLLGPINLEAYLDSSIEEVIVGGESGNEARLCDYDWVLTIQNQCVEKNVGFHFKQTGANFRKGDIIYRIERRYQHQQAKKANIDYIRK